jgi:HAD superfamily hydrolase (TIGR01490 family)
MQDKKVLAIFDFDDTLFNGQSHSYFLSFLESKLRLPKRILLKIRKRMVRSKLNDRAQKEYILSAFKGVSAEQIDRYASVFFSSFMLQRFYEPVCSILKEHQKKGHTVVIASGGFECYLKFLKEHLNIDDLICTKLKFENKVFTGLIDAEECLGVCKVKMVQEKFKTEDIDWENSYVYSDHKSDMPLFDLVGNKIVVSQGQTAPSWATPDYKLIFVQ